jgi:hypothetical protein
MKTNIIFLFIVLIILFAGYQKYLEFSITNKNLPPQSLTVPTATPISKEATSGVVPTVINHDYGFALSASTNLVRSYTTVFGRPVVLYCDTPIIEDTNMCTNFGVIVEVYDQPAFGGGCLEYHAINIAGIETTYCDDQTSKQLTQIFIDRSKSGKNSYSIRAQYSKAFSKEEALKVLSTFQFTN